MGFPVQFPEEIEGGCRLGGSSLSHQEDRALDADLHAQEPGGPHCVYGGYQDLIEFLFRLVHVLGDLMAPGNPPVGLYVIVVLIQRPQSTWHLTCDINHTVTAA